MYFKTEQDDAADWFVVDGVDCYEYCDDNGRQPTVGLKIRFL